MATVKVEGVKDDLDVVAIVTAFEAFKDAVQFISDSAESMVVDLSFESSLSRTEHYSFASDDVITLRDVKISPESKKFAFAAMNGATDKYFFFEEAELIKVTMLNDEGKEVSNDLRSHIQNCFNATFTGLGINSLMALQALVRNNPGLVPILSDPATFLEGIAKVGAREKAYAKLEKYGRY